MEGLALAELFPGRDTREMYANYHRLGHPYGISFIERTRVSNSHLALQAAEFARDQAKHDLYHSRILKAYFEDGLDIGQLEVILRVTESIGLDTVALSDALKEGRYEKRLQSIQEEARNKRIDSVPTFIINGKERIVGAQPLSQFRNICRAF